MNSSLFTISSIDGETLQDDAFIYNSWLKSYRIGNPLNREIPPQEYFAHQHRIIESLLPQSQILIANAIEEPDVILGYVVFSKDRSPTTIHYVYVKEAFRHMGICRSLVHLAAVATHFLPLQYSHQTTAWQHVLHHLGIACVYNHFRAHIVN